MKSVSSEPTIDKIIPAEMLPGQLSPWICNLGAEIFQEKAEQKLNLPCPTNSACFFP